MTKAATQVRRAVIVATCTLSLTAPSLSELQAQALLSVRRLAAPEASFPDGFTTITGMRELPDGRVLVADSRERTLRAVDLRTGASTAVGREGAGPLEWGMPSRLYAMPGDSTMMSDFSNARYLIILPDGRPGPTFRIPESSPAWNGSLVGVDLRGRLILTRAHVVSTERMGSTTGVVYVIRYDRASSKVDTIAELAVPKGERSGARSMPGGMLLSYTNLPFAASDAVASMMSLSHGRVAIVRAADYHMDWIDESGRRTAGPKAQPSAIRITAAEKEAFTKAQVRPGAIVVRGPIGGGAAAPGASSGGGIARGGAVALPPGSTLGNEEMTWPAVKPPVVANSVFLSTDGRVWAMRARAHDDSLHTYDLFDAAGRVAERVQLPARTRLVGFGKSTVYLARTDDDDLQILERYRLP